MRLKTGILVLAAMMVAAAPLGLTIVSERWDNTHDSRPLQAVLKNSDVLLGLDDPDLYNPKTAKNLLLSSYSQQQALVNDKLITQAAAEILPLSDQAVSTALPRWFWPVIGLCAIVLGFALAMVILPLLAQG